MVLPGEGHLEGHATRLAGEGEGGRINPIAGWRGSTCVIGGVVPWWKR